MLTNLEVEFMHKNPSALLEIGRRLDTRTIAAIMFGQALISGKSYFGGAADVAEMAVEYADALVEELNKTKQNGTGK